ncbi:MAG: hypothetical protein AAF639_19920 [Chloroflexota bacterium]
MKRIILRIILPILIVLALGTGAYTLFFTPAEFRTQANPAPLCQSPIFDKSAMVFDAVLICGTSKVPAEKLVHAANVAAEWLDNDEDGMVDDAGLHETLIANKPVVIMSFNGIPMVQMPSIFSAFSAHTSQDLSAQETNNPTRRDASQEEIHHVIMNAGWTKLLPSVFSDVVSEQSDLYQIWKFANDNGYYAYNDPTCDASCKVTEFVYLATAAYLGSEADLHSDELRLKTRDALQETIPDIITLFESSDYVYPTNHWPDGVYPHSQHIDYVGIGQ